MTIVELLTLPLSLSLSLSLSLCRHSGAARAGVENLMKSMTVEWSRAGVRINCVAPVRHSLTLMVSYYDTCQINCFRELYTHQRQLVIIPAGKVSWRASLIQYQQDDLAHQKRFVRSITLNLAKSSFVSSKHIIPHLLQVASVVCFLLSPAASYLTSTTLRVDGGQSVYRSNYIAPGKYITLQRYETFTCHL